MDRESKRDLYLWEALLSIILIIATAVATIDKQITKDTAVIIDVIAATLALSVVILKDYFAKVAQRLSERHRPAELKSSQIASILERLDGTDFVHASRIIDSALEKLREIPEGTLPLDANSYFVELGLAMKNARKGSRVIAVSSASMLRWQDPHQQSYTRQNFEAAKRGVGIHRIFIVDKAELLDAGSEIIRNPILCSG